MRLVAGSIAIISALSMRVCSSDEDVPPPPPVGATVAVDVPAEVAVDVEPRHGGTIVVAGEHPVEVVPHASGEVYAYVHGDAPPPGRVELGVVVPVRGGGTREVVLGWDRRHRRYAGHLRGAVIVPGPIDVELAIGTDTYHGHVATVVVAPAIVVDVHPVDVHVHRHGKHRKHRKHHGHGHGHGHGHVDVVDVHVGGRVRVR